jgi:hypothetical protein
MESIAKFSGGFRVLEQKDFELLGLSKASLISEASSLIPKEFSAEKNIDILPVVFNVALVNKFNANHDGINAENAAKILKQFVHKPINIEHNKTHIVGHIVNASFSDKQPEFEENESEDYKNRTSPFYITLAGFIYKHIYPGLANVLIEASNPESEYYQAYASSWEIRFTDYDIAVGSNLVSECKIYSRSSNPESFAKCVDKVKANGGTGFCEEGQVNRLLGGELYPLGCAFTENPAAEVSGIYPLTSFVEDEDDDEEDDEEMEEDEVEDKKNSNCSKTSVNRSDDEFSDMTDEQLNKLIAALKDAKSEGESNASVKEIAQTIEAALQEHGTEWKSKAEKAHEEIEALKTQLSNATKELGEAKEQFESVKNDLAIKEAADRFNARMKTVEDTYDLSEAEIKIVADDVRVLGDDTAFASYLEKAKILFAHKNKEALASKNEKQEEKQEEKSEEIETKGESKANIPNNNGNQTEEKSLIEKLKESGLEVE